MGNALDLKETFSWGRKDTDTCEGSGNRQPIASGCDETEEVFLNRMGLGWRYVTQQQSIENRIDSTVSTLTNPYPPRPSRKTEMLLLSWAGIHSAAALITKELGRSQTQRRR